METLIVLALCAAYLETVNILISKTFKEEN